MYMFHEFYLQGLETQHPQEYMNSTWFPFHQSGEHTASFLSSQSPAPI